MNDEPPFIIVDGRKIAPILRLSGRTEAPLEQAAQTNPPFGVVDRVTISRAARQRYRQSPFAAAHHSHPLSLTPARQETIIYDRCARLRKDSAG